MEFIDTHTHLYLTEFDHDREAVVKNAIDTGIKKLLLPNIDSSSIAAMMKMYSDHPGICKPMMGLHPGSVNENFQNELKIIEAEVDKPGIVGIGETGIDLYWDKTFKEQQIESFMIHAEWARSKDLPLVIHARESFDVIIDVLEKIAISELKGVFHSFTGNSTHVKKIAEMGFHFGINGIITYKNNELVNALKEIPPEKLLLETDSPFLSPVPKRGKRNESAFLIHIAQHVSRVLNIPLDELADITTRNARKLFNLD